MSTVKYVPTPESFIISLNGETNVIDAQIQCITAMEFYKDSSLEELRLNRYLTNSFSISPSEETKQHFTLKSYKPYVPVINLSPSCEDDSTVDCIPWPVQSSEPNSTQVNLCAESSRHSANIEQDSVCQSYSSSPVTDRLVEASVRLSRAQLLLVQNSGDEITSVSNKSSASCQELANIWTSLGKSDVDNVTPQKSAISPNSYALVSPNSDALVIVLNNDKLNNNKLTNFTEGHTLISSISHAAGNDAHMSSTSGTHKCAYDSDYGIKFTHGRGLAAAGSLLIERNIQNTNQNNDTKEEPAENGQPREQCGVESSKENSDALSDEISCLTDLQKSLSASIGQTSNRELLGWFIVNELQASRDIRLYQKLPLSLLRAEVKHRDMLTRQLMDLFQVIAIQSPLYCLIEVALVEEFGFICHTKRIMIAKSTESQNNKTSETRDGRAVRADSPKAAFSPGSSRRDSKQSRRVQIVPEENTNDDVCKHVSDLYARSLLSHETDVLMFSEPGKLFRFEVLPGSRFVESWKRRGSGVVSLFQDEAAEVVKIVVSHWSSKEDYSLVLIRSSMKTKTAVSRNGLKLKFTGLEVSKCRERIRYFMIQFESSRVTKAFNQLLHSLTFLNISDLSPKSGSTCCLDVVFKSQRIHEEFPSMMGDDETGHMTYGDDDDDDDDVLGKDELNKDGFHDVDGFKWHSDGKTVADKSPGSANDAECCIAEGLQTRRNSFPIFSRVLNLEKMPAVENQELGRIGPRCGQEATKTRICATSEKCLLDVKRTETNKVYCTGIEHKTETVKGLIESDCSETTRGISTENHSAGLSDAEISRSTNLFACADERCTGGPSFSVYRSGSGDIDEDSDETDTKRDRLKFIPEGGSHLSLGQDGGFTQNADRGNCDFKLSLGLKYQFPSADDQKLAGLKGESLLLEHGKIDDKDSNSVTTENQCRLGPTEVAHPPGICHDFRFSKVLSFKIPESSSVPNCDGFKQETSNVGSRNCDHAVKNDISENQCAVSHASEFNSKPTFVMGKSEEDEIVSNAKKLGIEESEVKQKHEQPLSDRAVADFLTCNGALCERATHLTRLLETVDANSSEKKVACEVHTDEL